jgi:hypothetical protein
MQEDYTLAFHIIELISLGSLFFFVPLPRNAGDSVSGHHEAAEDEVEQPGAPAKRPAE